MMGSGRKRLGMKIGNVVGRGNRWQGVHWMVINWNIP